MNAALAINEDRSVSRAFALLHDLESQLRRTAGNNIEPRAHLSGSITPVTYLEACDAAARQSKSVDPQRYAKFCEFVYFVRTALNALATKLKSSSSERSYLTALIDQFSLRPLAVMAGNFVVRLSAKDAEGYVGLSQSTCTNVRRSLSEKGVLIVSGDMIDLAPLIETIRPLISSNEIDLPVPEIGGRVDESCEPLPDFVTPGPNVISNVHKNTFTVKVPEDLFSRQAIKETIALSPKLTMALDDHFGKDHTSEPIETILDAMPNVAHSLLTDGSHFDYRVAWNSCRKRHGLYAFAFLLAAIEGRKKTHAGKWFFSMMKGKSREEIDLSPNIFALRDDRDRAIQAAKDSERLRLDRETRDSALARQQELSKRALKLLAAAKASERFDAEKAFWLTVPDRIQVKEQDGVILFALRAYRNKQRDKTMVEIVEHIMNDFNDAKSHYVFGSLAGTKSLSAFELS